MNDIERAVYPFQAADGAQPIGEDAAFAVLDGQDRTASGAAARRPSGATTMDVGLQIRGARAASSIDQPGAGFGKGSRSGSPASLRAVKKAMMRAKIGTSLARMNFPSLGNRARNRARSGLEVQTLSRFNPGTNLTPRMDWSSGRQSIRILPVSWGGAFYRPFPFISM